MKTKPLIYCHNHDVAVGTYECPYVNLVNNSIVCTSKECRYNSEHILFTSSSANAIVVNNLTEEERYKYCKTHLGAVYGKSVYDLLLNMSEDDLPF